jgi:predicted HTH transcriptional regulator
MQGTFFRPFDSLDTNDLLDLVETRRLREHMHLDYKRDPYDHNHASTVEMPADVTAMANAQGGYIQIGVEEDETEPDGTPRALIGIENGDAEAMWVQNVCLTSIDEKIPGPRVRDIVLPSGRSCVVIQVPNSVKKPHIDP